MELDKAKKIVENLPTKSKFVEIRYIGKDENLRTQPGYIDPLMDIIEKMPEYKHSYLHKIYQTEPPFLLLYTHLNRNQVPQEPIPIRIEDILYIKPAYIK